MNGQVSAKEAAGRAAAALVEEGMVVGLGTGTTASFFIAKLGERCRLGLKMRGVPTSQATLELALLSGIPLIQPNEVSTLDITIDGADEVDSQKQIIKGGGGALLREKIIASMSRELVIVVDEFKCVNKLGKVPLPIEIVPFAYEATLTKIKNLGHSGTLRMNKNGQLYMTENGNYIYDMLLSDFCGDFKALHQSMKMLPGVVETGLFIDMVGRMVIGYADGHVEIR